MVDYLLKETDYIIVGGVRRLSVYNHTNIKHITSTRFILVNFDLGDTQNIALIVQKLNPCPYGASKAASRQIIKVYRDTYNRKKMVLNDML